MSEEEKDTEPGELIYTSPECPPERRRKAHSIFGVFVAGGALSLILALLAEGDSNLQAALITAGWVLPILAPGISTLPLYPHLKVYSNGLSFRVHHWNPFSDCASLRWKPTTQGPLAGRSILAWKDMVCFERYEPKKMIGVIVHTRLDGKDIPWYYIHYRENGAVGRVVEALEEHGVREISVVCAECGWVSGGFDGSKCGKCGAKRF